MQSQFTETFAVHGDGGNLAFAFLPIDGDAPDIGPMTVTGSLPRHILPATTWANPFGTCLLTDHAGQSHRVFIFVAGTRSSAEPYQAFGRLARRAGAACFRLPRGMAATGPGNAPEMNWLATVYSYLKGTAFVVEGAGFSRLQSVFAASVEVLSLIHRGDVNGNAPSYPGSLRPGLPGVEGETRFELEPLDLAARESTPPESSGSPPSPPPEEVREWLANRYRSIPPADIGNGPEGEPLAFDTLAPFTQYLTASGHRVLEALEACQRAGWVRIVNATIREPASLEVPVCLRRLNLSVGRHELLGILSAVLTNGTPAAHGQPQAGASAAPPAPPPPAGPVQRAEPPADLTVTATTVWRLLQARGGKGIQGKAIVAALAKQGIVIQQTTLRRHILPELKPHGVKNHPARGGYYLDTSV